jgi:hypothetical protein
MSVRITNKATGIVLGKISDEDFQFLVDQLEEESNSDTDYYIDQQTVNMLQDAGGSASLIAFLRNIVTADAGVDIAWQRL